jgi:hypothetical protein
VALATTRRHDELCYVMYLRHKISIYCSEHYELSLIYVLKLELSLYCCHSVICDLF